MKVAVPRDQHWPMLGQAASSHTVTSSDERISAFVFTNPPDSGFFAATQRGRRRRLAELGELAGVTSTSSSASSGPVADEPAAHQHVGDAAGGARLLRSARGAGGPGSSSTRNPRSRSMSSP